MMFFSSCDDVDAVTVSITIGGEPRDIGVYCGSKRPPMLMSNDNRMEITFISHSASAAKGFKAEYKFVTSKFQSLQFRSEVHTLSTYFTNKPCFISAPNTNRSVLLFQTSVLLAPNKIMIWVGTREA